MPHIRSANPARRLFLSMAAVAILAIGCSGGGQATSAPPAPTTTNAPTATSAPTASSGASVQAGMMASGMFHDVDGSASGEAQLVVKPDGAYAVVLEGFEIDAIAHTNVVLVSNTDVTKSADVDKSTLLDLGPLKAASGMQDFTVPPDMAGGVMEAYHTVVIWDTEMAHAIAAAPLK